eukprot:SAG31_NODE_4398_length_3239_cov_6.414380_2_plen_191_part_00
MRSTEHLSHNWCMGRVLSALPACAGDGPHLQARRVQGRRARGCRSRRIRQGVTFSFVCPLSEKHGTSIARCNALIEKVSPFIGIMAGLSDWVTNRKMPTWGTCAGMILLSDRLVKDTQKIGGQGVIGGLNVTVSRNFFGYDAAFLVHSTLCLHSDPKLPMDISVDSLSWHCYSLPLSCLFYLSVPIFIRW